MRAGNGTSEPQEGPQAQVVAVEGLSQGTRPGAGSGRRDALLPVPGPPTARAVPVPQKLPCLAKATGRRPSTPAPRPAPGRRRAARPRSWRPRGVSWLRLRGPCWPDRHTREELLAVIQRRPGPIRAAADAGPWGQQPLPPAAAARGQSPARRQAHARARLAGHRGAGPTGTECLRANGGGVGGQTYRRLER